VNSQRKHSATKNESRIRIKKDYRSRRGISAHLSDLLFHDDPNNFDINYTSVPIGGFSYVVSYRQSATPAGGMLNGLKTNCELTREEILETSKSIRESIETFSSDGNLEWTPEEFAKDADHFERMLHLYALTDQLTKGLFPDENDRTAISSLCSSADQRDPVRVAVKGDFPLVPWQLLRVKDLPNGIKPNTTLDELAQCFLGYYAVICRFVIENQKLAKPIVKPKPASASVFINDDLPYAKTYEERAFLAMERLGYIGRNRKINENENVLVDHSAEFRAEVEDTDSDFIHLGCHSSRESRKGWVLNLGEKRVVVSSLLAHPMKYKKSPFIFLNSCKSNFKDHSEYWSIGKAFYSSNQTAAALIGSEVEIGDRASALFAGMVYHALFHTESSLGAAVMRARRDMAKKSSLVGFAYDFIGNPYISFRKR
jgi:hypothetical protein